MTIYEVLTGGCPIEGPNASATMVNQTNLVPESLINLVPGIPQYASDAVDKALAKQPEKRFPNCVQFAKAFLRGGSQVTRSPRSQGSSRSQTTGRPQQNAARTNPAAELKELPPAPAPMRKTKGASTKRSDSHSSRGKGGRVPCPKCKKVLPLKPIHAGRRGRCVFCKTLLQISDDLNTLTQIRSASAQTGRGNTKRTGDTVHNQSAATSREMLPGDADELIIGEELFGWKLSKATATFLFMLLVTVLIGASAIIGYVQSLPTEEEINKNRANTYSNREAKTD